MTITKDVWHTLANSKKDEAVIEALTQLASIEDQTHLLSNRLDQGRLAGLKKDLEAFILNTADWESKPVQQIQFRQL